jgi:type II secretion system protein J
MKRTLRQSRGFTLLELIVAMTMIVVISAALYSSLNAAFRGKRAAERAITPIRAASVAMGIFERNLANVMLPHLETLNLESEVFYLAGPFQAQTQSDSSWISFYTMGSENTPDIPLSEGVRRVEYTVVSDGNAPALVRRVARNILSGDFNIPAEEEEILCENVRSFTLRYFDGVDWYDAWDSTQMVDINGAPAIPMVVQMELVLNMEGVSQLGEEPGTYRISKLIPLPCAKAVDLEQTSLLGSTTP